MSDATVLHERIARILSTQLNVEVATGDTDLFESGTLDSLAFVELLVALEREFGIQVPLEELELDRFRSVEKIAAFVLSRNGARGGS